MEAIDPDKPLSMRAAYIDRMQGVIKGREINRHLANLPEEKHGVAIARFLNGDPKAIANLPADTKAWAMRFADDARTTQQKAWEEGLIDDETRKKIGDVWFPTTRKGTPLQEEGPATRLIMGERGSKALRLVSVPRTKSLHFLPRQTTKSELNLLLTKQEAVEAIQRGDPNQALKLLKGPDFEDARRLLREGNTEGATASLNTAEMINVTPENLTMRGLLQQKLLFENFRYLRDISMDVNYAKTAEEVAKLGAGAQKQWRRLDQLPNSNIIRRMVAKKAGREVYELGYVHENVFTGLTDLVTGQPGMASGTVDLLELATAIHKTAKTALNPFTHGQNVLGNYSFLMWAGMNPFSREGFGLIKQSYDVVRDMQKARRAGREITEIGGNRILKSKVGGPDIDVAEELRTGALQEIIEQSSLLASEGAVDGVGILGRIAQKADDGQDFVKAVAKMTQKVSSVGAGPVRIDNIADIYMAEDAAFKMAYYMKLRTEGMSQAASALEVSRRLPMYHTIGPAPRQWRKVVLPWISFPVEALRIVKNNMIDYPLRMGMWMHAMEGMQAAMYPFTGESYEGLRDIQAGLPFWAQKPASTVVTPFRDGNDDIRAAVLDWLPYSSFLPSTVAKDAPFLQKMPLGLDQPMPILTGILNALTGKGQFGEDVPTSGPAHKVANAVMNTVGFIAPPLVQKYLLNTSAPSPTYRLKQDLGMVVNPSTVKPGDTMFDFFINNVGMVGKMYPSSPEQRLSNEQFTRRGLIQYRGRKARDWNAYIRSGDWESAAGALSEIMETFNQEWHEPAVANQKMVEWLKRHARDILKHPRMKGTSKEQLISRLTEMGDEVGKARGEANAKLVEFLREQIAIRGFNSNGGTTNPLTGAISGGLGGGLGGGI